MNVPHNAPGFKPFNPDSAAPDALASLLGQLVEAALRSVPGCMVSLDVRPGNIRLSVTTDEAEATPGTAPFPQEEQAVTPSGLNATDLPTVARRQWHSEDWRVVEWGGRRYVLTEMQGAVVRQLWLAAEEQPEYPEVAEGVLLNGADSDSARLVDVFKRSPAWKNLVVQTRPGHFRLAALPAVGEE